MVCLMRLLEIGANLFENVEQILAQIFIGVDISFHNIWSTVRGYFSKQKIYHLSKMS